MDLLDPDSSHMNVAVEHSQTRSSHWLPLAMFMILLAVYGSTANWSISDQNVDTIAATLPAWHLITEGNLDLTSYEGQNPWFVETPSGVWTNRPPGLIGAAVIAHAPFIPFDNGYHGYPGTLVSVALTAAAVTIVAGIVRRRVGGRAAWIAVVALGVGTAAWPQASGELVPHGVDMFILALVLLSLERDRPIPAGVLLGIAITVRPPLAIAALALGVGLAWQRRDLRPLLQLGAPSGIGLGLLVLYNRLVFGAFSISGGYGDFLEKGATYRTPTGYLQNLAGTFFDPTNGLFLWSSWILVAILVAVMLRSHADSDWPVVAALAGLAYLLVHTGLNRYSGGVAFSYRYSLEPLVLAMPYLAQAFSRIMATRPLRMVFLVALGVSIALQGSVAILLTCTHGTGGISVCSLT